MCLYPKLIYNKKYTINKKNGGEIPQCVDERVKNVPVGCGKCIECRKQKARGWQVRLQEDLRYNKNGKFVTLTFSERELQKLDSEVKKLTGYDRDNEICRKAVRRFTERWRKKYKKTIRHWLVTEIGGKNTERIHLHGLLWTDNEKEISKIWKYGNVKIGDGKVHYVNERTVNYIVKYVSKVDEKHKNYVSKIYASNGIGKGYIEREDAKLNKYKEGETKETYTTRSGLEIALPVYYRNKIYSEEEKEKLWIEKLDKQERWVMGVKVDISEGEEEYNKLLKAKQLKNIELGYGDNEENWELKEYEKQRRNMKRLERMTKLYGTANIENLKAKVFNNAQIKK